MNKVIIMGRLTRDADIRWTQGQEQKCIARFTLAVDRKGRTQEGQQSADFISCVCFGKLAEWFEKWTQKGTKVAAVGRIQTGSYTNRDGQKVYTTDVVVDEAEFAESKSAQSGSAPTGQTRPQEQSRSGQYPTDPDGFMSIPDGIEEELPFN